MAKLCVTSFLLPVLLAAQVPRELDRYNVVWTSPGASEREAMPFGNGELGVSMWIVEDGDLQFYFARSDALTEQDRKVKLGKVRLRITPNPFAKGARFKEQLILGEGRVEIDAGGGRLRAFVHADHPVLFIEGEFDRPCRVTATYTTWRTKPRPGHPSEPPETADVVEPLDSGVLFYHANGESSIRSLAELQGLKDHLSSIPDTLKDRKFGGWMTLTGSRPDGAGALTAQAKAFTLKVATHSDQTASLNEWIGALKAIHTRAGAAAQARAATAAWWRRYWSKSWLFASGDKEAELVTRAYVLTKWMFTCARGISFPMMFNGAVFNLMPAGDGKISIMTLNSSFGEKPAPEPTFEVNPDLRAWGHMNLYQNQRLPYLSMLARGEPENLKVLFRYYRRFWDLNRVRARIYYSARGQHNTEITHSFGLQTGGVYGYKRDGLPVGYSVNRAGGAVDISPGLELAQLMLDYCDYTQDTAFLQEEVIPYARELAEYIATRFRERENGRIVIAPLQSVETYYDTTDPVTVVAGMRAVLARIGAPLDAAPDIPLEQFQGATIIAPARRYKPERKNVESPAFYTVFPFRLYGLGKPNLDLAIATFRASAKIAESMQPFQIGWQPNKPSFSGWQQHGMVAAMLGLAEDARRIVVDNSRLNSPGNRFPAMWGPIYDSVPDIDHGANILNTLQLMALQSEGDRITPLPAWPKTWDVSFRLYSAKGAPVTCVYQNGRIKSLTPAPAAK